MIRTSTSWSLGSSRSMSVTSHFPGWENSRAARVFISGSSSAFGRPAVVVDKANSAAGARRRRLGAGAGGVVEALVPDGRGVGQADRLGAVPGVAGESVAHEVVFGGGQAGAPGGQP